MATTGSDSRSLQLQISASTELLIRNLKQADNAVAAFQQQTDNRLSAVDRAFAKSGTNIRNAFAGLAAGVSVGTLIGLAKQGLDYASSLDEVSQQVGVTARDLQVLRYAGSQVGISTEEMDAGLQKFTKSLGAARSGSTAAIGVFKQLGFSDADIKKLDAHDALLKTADGISQIGDRSSRAAPEVALFGKAGQQLDTLLSSGSAGINGLAKAAEDLGIVLSHSQIENADAAADKLGELKQVLEAKIAGFVADNAKAIYEFADALEDLALEAASFVTDTTDSFKGLAGLFDPFVDGGNRAFDKLGLRIASFHDQIVSVLQGIDTLRNIPLDVTNGLASRFKQQTGFALPDAVTGTAEVKRSTLANDFERNYQKARSDRAAAGGGANPAAAGDRTYHDPAAIAAAAKAALEAARKAAAEQKKEEARQKRVADETARLDDAYLSSLGTLTADTAEQARIAREKLTRDTAAKLADVDSRVTSGDVKEAEAAGLRAQIRRNAAIEADTINQRENIGLEREAQALAEARLGDLRDIAGSDASLATTARARLEIALRVLAAEKEAERTRLQAIVDDKKRPDGNRHYSDGDIDVASEGLSTLDQRYDGQEAIARRSNAGPMGTYKDQLQRAVGDTNEALEGVEVNAFRDLEDSMVGVISGTESVASAFKKMAASIIADLARVAIEQTILGALGGSTGGGSILGKLFGGGRASGGPVSGSKFYVVGENGPELFAPGVGGSIIPNHALAAPRLGNISGSGRQSVHVSTDVNVNPSPMFATEIQTSTYRSIAASADPIMAGATARTLKEINKVRPPGGYG